MGMVVWSVHLSDGILDATWSTGGFFLGCLLAAFGGWRMREEEVPRVALLTAAFFVASLVHVGVPGLPTTVHLLLNGLVGVLLGRRAALAIPVGLFLQMVLFSHGGYTTWGINSCILVLPALAAGWAFSLLARFPWLAHPWARGLLVGVGFFSWTASLVYGLALLATPSLTDLPPSFHRSVVAVLFVASAAAAVGERRLENRPEFPLGLLLGVWTVLLTIGLQSVVLWQGGAADGSEGTEGIAAGWRVPALLAFVVHAPIAAIEGVVLGFLIGFLARVKPEMLGASGGRIHRRRWAEPTCQETPRPLPAHPAGEGVP